MNELLLGSAFLLSLWGTPVEASNLPINVPNLPTLQQQAQQIAKEYDVSFDLMDKIIFAESSWIPDRVGDKGRAFGLAQIHLDYNASTTKEQALDPDYALRFLAQRIKEGREYEWTICNCVSEVRRLGASVPFKDKLIPNTDYPRVGGVVIMQYKDRKHLAYIDSVQKDGIHIKEANYQKCSRTQRIISPTDHHIIGYWHSVK